MPKTRQGLIVTAEVAARLRVDVRTVHRLVERGQLEPAAKTPGVRGAFLFDEEDVARLESERSAA